SPWTATRSNVLPNRNGVPVTRRVVSTAAVVVESVTEVSGAAPSPTVGTRVVSASCAPARPATPSRAASASAGPGKAIFMFSSLARALPSLRAQRPNQLVAILGIAPGTRDELRVRGDEGEIEEL